MNRDVEKAMDRWFLSRGAYVLVDGQFGSTGKGVIAGALAECFANRVDRVLSNAGPNSGHTSFYGGEKIILKQLPTFSVIASKIKGRNLHNDFPGTFTESVAPPAYLTAGAVIDPTLLQRECNEHGFGVEVHPNAAVIDEDDRIEDRTNVSDMASTGQGVGPAIINKLKRTKHGVIGQLGPELFNSEYPRINVTKIEPHDMAEETLFLEVSQGFSLGINSGFYPHVTTRECTVSQALSDAGLPPSMFRKSVLSVRTFPIRVGSTENSSGPCYPDQLETDWSKVGVEPEYTTVTKRIRRIFTWSDIQFREAVFANQPSAIFCNFVNYLRQDDVELFIWNHICKPYVDVMGILPETVLLGYGPRSSDIKVWRQ